MAAAATFVSRTLTRGVRRARPGSSWALPDHSTGHCAGRGLSTKDDHIDWRALEEEKPIKWPQGPLKGTNKTTKKTKLFRTPRPRTAMAERRQFIADRQTAFQVEAHLAAAAGLDWALTAATVLERLPIVTPEPEPWEKAMMELQWRARSHARQYPRDVGGGLMGMDPSDYKTWDEVIEESPVLLSPRVTEADRTNDRTSLQRALHDRLYLIVQTVAKNAWQFPQSELKPGETLRQAAERTLSLSVIKKADRSGSYGGIKGIKGVFPGKDAEPEFWFVGNCPAGWDWGVLGEKEQRKTRAYGQKVFYHRCQLIDGMPQINSKLHPSYLWVTKSELCEYFDSDVADYLRRML